MIIDDFDGFFDSFQDWTQSVDVFSVTETTIDFEPVYNTTQRTITGVVQPTNPSTLNIDTLDYTLKYITIHTTDALSANEFVVYKGDNYRVLNKGGWSDYTFNKVLCEEYKKDIEGV